MLISAGTVIDLVQSHFSGAAKKRDTQQLTIRYLGLVLFEMRRNIDLVTELVAFADRAPDLNGEPPSSLYGSLNFDVSAASFGEVIKFLPVPSAISTVQAIIAELKQVDLQQRMVLDDLPIVGNASQERAGLDRVAVVARRFIDRGRPRQFNSLRELAGDLLRTAYGDEGWQAVEAEILPMPLDLPPDPTAPPPTPPDARPQPPPIPDSSTTTG